MHRRVQLSDDEEDEPYNEAGPDSPSSWEDSKITKPSSKKSRRNVEKRVVSVPIADVEGSKSRGEAYPPSDSWAWRKYGQKPIKGSPYPRGYYRCSSSKGCPARKQVERSRVDPTKLVITYACDHNHPRPAAAANAKSHHHHRNDAVAKSSKQREDNAAAAASEEPAGLDLSHVDSPMLLSGCYCEPEEVVWFYDVALSGGSICAGNVLADADVALERGLSIGEEDESLFSDLGDLPDCTAVFRHGKVAPEEQSRRGDFDAVPFCDSSA